MTKKLWVAVLAIAGLLALPILASAAHWPNFGGDAGRSGFQPVNMGALPLKFKFRQAVAGQPQTSPVITDAPSGEVPRVAFGVVRETVTTTPSETSTFTCEVHIFRLDATGTRVGSESRPNLCPAEPLTLPGSADPAVGEQDAFGSLSNNSVTPVSSSGSGDFGQLFVIRNEANANAREVVAGTPQTAPSFNDIAIAQYDERTGEQVADIAVGSRATGSDACSGLTAELRVDSSPVITPRLNGAGDRAIFFIASGARGGTATAGCPRNNSAERYLVRIYVPAAHTRNALNAPQFDRIRLDAAGASGETIAEAARLRANEAASPTIAYLRDPNRDSSVFPYVVVPGRSGVGVTTPGKISTFKVENIRQPGPLYTTESNDTDAQTVSVPVGSNGEPAGSGGTGAAPGLYVAFTSDGGRARVRRLVQSGSVFTESAASAQHDGLPAPALALNDVAEAPASPGARVVLTTGAGLFVLSASDLRPQGSVSGSFKRTTASIGGDRIYAMRDTGAQSVLRLSNGAPVCGPSDVGTAGCAGAQFAENSENAASSFGIGQPALSRRMSAFLSGSPPSGGAKETRGTARLFVYEASTLPPVADFSVTPNPVQQGQAVTFDASASKDPDGSIVRYEWDLDGNGDFETDLGKEPKFTTFAVKAGTFNAQLRVTDDEGATDTEVKQLVITPPPPNQNPTASFAVAPNPAKTGERVSFDARASKDPDGKIVKFEWDLDGNGSFETTTTTPTASRTFARAGVILAKLKVTDDRGGTAEATQQLVVTRAGRVAARRLTSRVRPRVDTTVPHRFRATGRLVPASSVPRSRACRGRVTIVVKNRKETISRRTTKLRRTCRYSQRVTFRDAERLEGATSLRFKARFQGNRALLPRQAKTRRVRISN